MIKHLRYVIYTVLFSLLLITTAQSAGFKRIKIDRVDIGIWYPSDDTTAPLKMGPRQFDVALNGTIKAGVFDVVLLSHGLGGWYRNHHITAEQIADAGYIVIGLNHKNDYMVGGPAMSAVLEARTKDLHSVFKLMQENTFLSPHMSHTIHAVGYSLGGMTALIASGATFNTDLYKQYCDENGKQDKLYCSYDKDKAVYDWDFCKKPKWKLSWQMNSFPPFVTRTCANTSTNVTPFVNGHAVVIAPSFQGLDITKPLSAKTVTIVAITGDTVVQPQFQTDPLYKTLQQTGTSAVKKTTAPAFHLAFTPQLPKWIRDEENIPSDPADFNRLEFINTINKDIITALQQ